MRRVPRRVAPLASACLAVLLLLLALPAAAPPAVPMRIQGHAEKDEVAVSKLQAEADGEGVDYSNGSVVYDDSGSYSILVAGNARAACRLERRIAAMKGHVNPRDPQTLSRIDALQQALKAKEERLTQLESSNAETELKRLRTERTATDPAAVEKYLRKRIQAIALGRAALGSIHEMQARPGALSLILHQPVEPPLRVIRENVSVACHLVEPEAAVSEAVAK